MSVTHVRLVCRNVTHRLARVLMLLRGKQTDVPGDAADLFAWTEERLADFFACQQVRARPTSTAVLQVAAYSRSKSGAYCHCLYQKRESALRAYVWCSLFAQARSVPSSRSVTPGDTLTRLTSTFRPHPPRANGHVTGDVSPSTATSMSFSYDKYVFL